MTRADSLAARLVRVLYSPRATFEQLVNTPRFVGALVVTFLVTSACATALFRTEVGQIALLDQWERTAVAFGRTVDDSRYAALEKASRNDAEVYAIATSFVTGPVLAVGLSLGFVAAFRLAKMTAPFSQVLAVVAHAGVVLMLRQLVAAPVTYVRETLASPVTMSIFFTTMDENSPAARFFGIIDLFVMWWLVVLAIGMSVLYHRSARRLALMFVGIYVTVAIILAVVMAVMGSAA